MMSLVCSPETTVIASPFCNFCLALFGLINATMRPPEKGIALPLAGIYNSELGHFDIKTDTFQI
jgi:hypothetical protein